MECLDASAVGAGVAVVREAVANTVDTLVGKGVGTVNELALAVAAVWHARHMSLVRPWWSVGRPVPPVTPTPGPPTVWQFVHADLPTNVWGTRGGVAIVPGVEVGTGVALARAVGVSDGVAVAE